MSANLTQYLSTLVTCSAIAIGLSLLTNIFEKQLKINNVRLWRLYWIDRNVNLTELNEFARLHGHLAWASRYLESWEKARQTTCIGEKINNQFLKCLYQYFEDQSGCNFQRSKFYILLVRAEVSAFRLNHSLHTVKSTMKNLYKIYISFF